MGGITGYDLDDAGPPAGICGWCWRSTWSVGVSPITGVAIPAHITCIWQMQIVKKRLDAGTEPNERPTPGTRHTVAWQRYFRNRRVAVRLFREARTLEAVQVLLR